MEGLVDIGVGVVGKERGGGHEGRVTEGVEKHPNRKSACPLVRYEVRFWA